MFTRATVLFIILILIFDHSKQDCSNIKNTVNVNETLSQGDKITTFPSDVQMALHSGKDKFEIINNTLYSKIDFDFEKKKTLKTYKFKMMCTYNNTHHPPLDYFIFVNGVNEFPPGFPNQSLLIFTPENTAVNTSVYTFKGNNFEATDKDIYPENNVTIRYAIQNDVNKTFEITDSQNGVIQLKKKLDYIIKNLYILNISATDGEFFGFMLLNIQVLDNDNLPPAFTSLKYQLSVPEEAYYLLNTSLKTVPEIHAYDKDTGINQTINYKIHKDTKSDAFLINSSSGKLQLSKVLDRETQEKYTVFVLAYQTDLPLTKTAIAVVEVTVLDIDDNLPEFENDVYNVQVLENAPEGLFVHKFSAVDVDNSPNNIFTYKLYDQYNAFNLNATTGELTVRNSSILDRETHEMMKVKVSAVEKTGNESKMCDLNIKLLDVNDNNPVFERAGYLLFAKDLSNGSYIGSVVATDADVGKNAELRYGLTDLVQWGEKPPPIYIEDINGRIFANTFLRPATSYKFFLQACDYFGDPSFHRCTKVPVMIVAKNASKSDNTRIVHHIYVDENTPIKTRLIDLKTLFDDERWGMTFIKLRTKFPVPIKIMRMGEVFVDGPLDYESVTGYELKILAFTDTVSANITLFVHVQDVNDHTPTFSQLEYTFLISSKMPAGHIIGKISVTDRDGLPPNNETFFVIPGSFSISEFVIIDNKTGNLVLKKPLPSQTDKNNLEFLVKATDKGHPPLSSLVTVKLMFNKNLNVYMISTSLSKQLVEENKMTFEKNMTAILGIQIVIERVEYGEHYNSGQHLQLGGSTIYLSGTDTNGTKISREKLRSLVLSKEILLQAVFDKDKLKTIPDYWKPGTTEISLLVLATFLLICCIICIYVVCVKHQMEQRTRRLLHNLNRDQSLYISQELKLGRRDYYHTSRTEQLNGINNQGFQFDRMNESDVDSGPGHGNKTDPTEEETDTGFQTSTISISAPSTGDKVLCNGGVVSHGTRTKINKHSAKESTSTASVELVSVYDYEKLPPKMKHVYENMGDSSDSIADDFQNKNIYDKPDVIPAKRTSSKKSYYDKADNTTQNIYDIPNNMSSNSSLYDKPTEYPLSNSDEFSLNSSHLYSNVSKHHYEHLGSLSDPPSEPHPDYIVTGSETSNYSGNSMVLSSSTITPLSEHSPTSTSQSNFTEVTLESESKRVRFANNGSVEDLSLSTLTPDDGSPVDNINLHEQDIVNIEISTPVDSWSPCDNDHSDDDGMFYFSSSSSSMTHL